MPTLTLQASYKKNSGLVISPEELMSLFFYGLNIRSTDGTLLSNEDIEQYIRSAQGEVERYFDLILSPCMVTEVHDYYRDDYENGFPFIRVSYPVRKIKTLIGRLNGIDQIRYPEEWLQMRTSSKNRWYRQFSVVPNGSIINADANVILLGISAYYGLRSYPQIPNYWSVQYETGYLPGTLPSELITIIGQLSAIPILSIYGDLVLSSPGIGNMSLGIDGLSQSVGSKQNAFGERIKQYMLNIDTTAKRIKNTYKGVAFVSL